MRGLLLALVLLSACASDPKRDAGREREAPPGTSGADAVFDADTAWSFLERQVAFGPRVPGTASHRACGEWIAATLTRMGGTMEWSSFSYRDPEGTAWPLVNVIGRFGPEGGGRLLLVAHWDTRPWADQDPDPANRDKPIPGANDGASGVAVLLEIARHLGTAELPRGVDILFVDGEDLGRTGDNDGFCQGSRYFASQGLGGYRRAVVLDMVADRDQAFPVESFSLRFAPEVVDWVWKRGQKLSPEIFSTVIGPSVFDDHMPLIEAGLPAADVIDFDYPSWHTLADDLDAVSRESLGAVGKVILSLALDP